MANVDACGIGDAGDVGAVVEDDAEFFGCGGDQDGGDFLEMSRGQVFGAELDKLDAGVGEFIGERDE